MANGVFLFIARAWTQLTSVILLLLAARVLDPVSLGVFALASALTMVLSQWVGVGTYEYVIKTRGDPDAASTGFWTNLGAALLLAGAGFVVSLFAGDWFRSPTLSPLIAALAPLTVPAGCRSIAEAVMLRDGRITRLSRCIATLETVSLIAGIVALYSGLGVWSLVVHKWTQSFGGAVIFMIASQWGPAPRLSRATARAIFKFGIGIFGDRFMGFFQTYGVDLVLGALLSPVAVAVYRLSSRMVSVVTTIVTEPARQLSWKRLTDAAAHGGSVPRAVEDLILTLYLILTGPLVGVAATSDLIVRVAFGDKWTACAPVITLLALTPLVSLPQLLTEPTLGSVGKTRWLPILRAVAVAAMAILLVLFARFGPEGAAASQLATAAVVLIMSVTAQYRLAGVRLFGYLRDASLCVLAAALMAATIFVLKDLFHSWHTPYPLRLIACVSAGAAVYLACVIVLFRDRLREAWHSFVATERP